MKFIKCLTVNLFYRNYGGDYQCVILFEESVLKKGIVKTDSFMRNIIQFW